jgi:hypothetical protein
MNGQPSQPDDPRRPADGRAPGDTGADPPAAGTPDVPSVPHASPGAGAAWPWWGPRISTTTYYCGSIPGGDSPHRQTSVYEVPRGFDGPSRAPTPADANGSPPAGSDPLDSADGPAAPEPDHTVGPGEGEGS